MEIYKTRYQARKHAYGDEVVVKVDAGCGEIGYTIMSAADYRIWKKNKNNFTFWLAKVDLYW